MSNRVSNRIFPKAYPGLNSINPLNVNRVARAPTQFDRDIYEVGDLWIDTANGDLYYLSSLAGDGTSAGELAHWIPLNTAPTGNVSSFNLDAGTAHADAFGVVNLFAGTNTNTVGDNLTTMFVNLNDSILLPATTGANAGVIALGTDLTNDRFIHNYGNLGAIDNNVFLGRQAGNFTLTGTTNVGIGYQALNAVGAGRRNIAIGDSALSSNIVGNFNVAIGDFSLGSATNNSNTALGFSCLSNLTSGIKNIAIGSSSGSAYTTESNNIAIFNPGVALDSGTIRIGTAGTQTSAYMAGITGVTTSTFSANKVMSVGTDGQLGEVLLESDDASVAITQSASGAINFRATGGGGGGSSNPYSFSYVQTTDGPNTAIGVFYELGSSVVLTQLFDVGSNVYPGSGAGAPATFTAPVTGKYYFNFSGNVDTASVTTVFKIVTTVPARTYTQQSLDYAQNYSVVTDMDMGSTATFSITNTAAVGGFAVKGDGAGQDNLKSTRISGFLIPESSNGGAFAQPFLGIQQADAIGVVGLPGTVYLLGAGAPINEVYDIGNNFTPGNGVGLEARFVAPETGVYEFTISAFSTNGSNDIAIGLNTPGISYFTNIPGSSISGVPSYIGGEKSFSVPLTAGDIVTFPVSAGRPLAGSNDSDIVAGFAGNTFISTASHDVTYIYGKRIG